MAVALSAATQAAALKAHADVRTLLKIDFTKPISGTFRFSDQHLPNCGSAEWLPYVLRWGRMTSRVDLQSPSVSPETFSVVLDNSRQINGKARLSDYIWTPQNTRSTYEWANAKVTVYQALSETADAADLVTLGVFYVEEPSRIGQGELEVTMSDVTLAIENKMQLLKITSENFTSAPTSSLNKYVPVPFGDLAGNSRYVSLIPIVAGAKTELTADLLVADTTMTVTSTSAFPTTGYLVMGGTEVISYTGKTATTFTGLTRGLDVSDAQGWVTGDAVCEARSGTSAYRLLVGMNILGGVKDVTKVVADDEERTDYTKRLAVTSLVTGYSLALVDFDVTATDAGVVSFHRVTSPGQTQAANDAGNTGTEDSFPPYTQAISAGDNDFIIQFPAINVAGPGKFTYRFRMSVSVSSANSHTLQVQVTHTGGGSTVFSTTSPFLNTTSELEFTFDVNSSTPNVNATFTLSYGTYPPAQTATVTSMERTWEPSASVNNDAESTLEMVVGSEVKALVEGIKDDGSGTVSGTPDLLLENPTDIAKAIVLYLYDTAPGTASGDLGTTWAATRTKHATAGYEWALLLDYMSFSTLRTEMLREGRALLYAAGDKVEWRFLDAGPSVDHTVSYTADAGRASPALLDRVDRTRLRNSLIVESQYDPSDGEYKNTVTWQDLTQPGFEDVVAETLGLPWVHSTTMRDDLGRFWRDQWKRPRLESEFDSAYNLIALQIVDAVEFTGHVVLAEHGDTSVVFLVVGRSLDPSRGVVAVALREADNLFWDREYFAGAVLDEPRAVPALVPVQYSYRQRMLARRDPSESARVYGRRSRLLTSMGG